jgi:ubiquitin-conjugating enzyme E2 I
MCGARAFVFGVTGRQEAARRMATLAHLRKQWRQDHPHGFVAIPRTVNDQLDLTCWTVTIPGRLQTSWEGGKFQGLLSFPPEYPSAPPKFTFTPPVFHPNVYPSGEVCISILNPKSWIPDTTLSDMLISIQYLLANPTPSSPAQLQAVIMYMEDRDEYEKRIRDLALRCGARDENGGGDNTC